MRRVRFYGIASGVLLASSLAACGGGGGTAAVVPPATTINGIAAAGAPIVGVVTAKDSKGATFGPATIDATGAYALNVTGGVAPFILSATGITAGTGSPASYHSIVDSTSLAGNINITPLTEMVVAQAAGQSPATLYTNFAAATAPTNTQVSTAQTAVNGSLANLFTQFGVSTTGLNLITSTFVAGSVATQSAIDVLLDAITVQPATATSFNIVANSITGLPANTVLLNLPATATSTPLAVNAALNASAVAAASSVASQTVLGGTYSGTYAGPDAGTWTITVSASGVLTGTGVSNIPANPNIAMAGTVLPNGTATFGNVTTGASFTTHVTRAGAISGTWTHPAAPGVTGTITGTKHNAVAAFATGTGIHSGTFAGASTGTWQFTGSANGTVTGTVTSATGTCPISGVINRNGTITSTIASNLPAGCGATTFIGRFSKATNPTIQGSWTSGLQTGTFSGT